MQFEFATSNRIIFGNGSANQIPALTASMGQNAFVLTGSVSSRIQPLLEQLSRSTIRYETYNISDEPTIMVAQQAVSKARQASCNIVISIGGGSVLDTGKVVAAMLTNSGKLHDYLEVVGKGNPLINPCAPHIAVPTTSGTGAEVTRNAVLSVPESKVKVSMRSPLMIPTIAIVDPELTISMPQAITASTGLDAITQLIEAFVSINANPLTDGICKEGITRAARSLHKAFEDGTNINARTDMALASLFSGLALANAKLGAVHGFAGPLGGMISAPHGMICATLLPHVTKANILALQQRSPHSKALTRYDEIARILTGSQTATASDAIEWISNLSATLNVRPLSTLGLTPQQIPTAVDKSKNSSSMKGNPITLTETQLTDILQKSL